MQKTEPIEHGHFYHIYNHGVGGRELFLERANYEYFLKLYDKYVSVVAETYGWVLMKNHFHFLVRIKEQEEINTPDRVQNPVRDRRLYKNPSLHFSHLFNSYAQAINKRQQTRGALFERPFNRKQINDEKYLRQVILYIHNNPVHHGFCEHPSEYLWSSYLTCLSDKPTKLMRNEVIDWFGDKENFVFMHQKSIDIMAIEKWLEIGE